MTQQRILGFILFFVVILMGYYWMVIDEDRIVKMDTLVDLPGEEWLPFRNYMISNKGRVFSQKQKKLITVNCTWNAITGCSYYP